jgi:hypothetical protein
MPSHQERVARHYDTPTTSAVGQQQFDASPAVNTAAIKQWEADVRLVLDSSERDYVTTDVIRARRRLRLLVGDSK